MQNQDDSTRNGGRVDLEKNRLLNSDLLNAESSVKYLKGKWWKLNIIEEDGRFFLVNGTQSFKILMRYMTLFLMIAQCVSVVLCMKASLIVYGEKKYLSSVAVLMAEIIKLCISLFAIWFFSEKKDLSSFSYSLYVELTDDWKGNLLVLIPSFLFLIQNNLLYISLRNLPTTIYQVTYQLKILTSALFSVIILKRKISFIKWIACFILMVGVVFVSKSGSSGSSTTGNFFLGLCSALCCCCTSGLGAVILEKVLKSNEGKTSIWGRNVVLAFCGCMGSIFVIYMNDRDNLIGGMFQNFTPLVWFVILLNATGGFIIAGILKYADCILKCFANAASIVIIALCSSLIFGDLQFSANIFFGSTIVIWSTYIYGLELFAPKVICDKFKHYKNLLQLRELEIDFGGVNDDTVFMQNNSFICIN